MSDWRERCPRYAVKRWTWEVIETTPAWDGFQRTERAVYQGMDEHQAQAVADALTKWTQEQFQQAADQMAIADLIGENAA